MENEQVYSLIANHLKILQLILIFSVISFGNDLENKFKEGTEYYLKGEYQKAINIYKTLNREGYQGLSLYYNLGNSYFRIGKIGLSILNYEKAKKLSPSDEDIVHNLNFANSKIVDRIETLPRFFIFDWWEKLLQLFNVSGWTYAAYIFYTLILISIGYYYFAGSLQRQRVAFYSGVLSSFLLAITIILLLVNLNREINVKYAIVVEPAAAVKFAPDQNSKDAFIVHEGLKVTAEDNIEDWVKIRLIDGKVGWMKQSELEII